MSSSSELEELLAPYLKVDQIVTRPISTLTVLFFLYGIHVVVSGLAIRILLVRRDGCGDGAKLYLPCTIALLVLITVYTGLSAWEYSRETSVQFGAASTKDYGPFVTFLLEDVGKVAWSAIASMTSNFMNVIADTMLIHRCYVIWNSNKLVLYPLVFVAFVVNGNPSTNVYTARDSVGVGVDDRGPNLVDYPSSAKVNGPVSEYDVHGYRVHHVVESGFLYAATLIGYAVDEFLSQGSMHGLVPFDPIIVVVPMSGLAPTLVIVRVAYRKSVDSVQQMMTTVQFAEGREDEQQSESTVAKQTTVDMRGGIRVKVDGDSSPSSEEKPVEV
ncbi:hypothetical protein PQX77_008687 [Marasmius sp. AFHP31]|nr:hypothetical protein PQX77_008687 [Marasmius sp. AFHP31]